MDAIAVKGRKVIARCLTPHALDGCVFTPVNSFRLDVFLRAIFDSSRNDEEKLQVDSYFYHLFNC